MKAFSLILIILFTATLSVVSSAESSINQIEQHNEVFKFPFERKIWTYWNSDKNEIPLIVKICLDNLESVAKKHNFTFVCLNESNVRNYIANYDQEFIEVRKKSIQKDFAHAADLLRMIIIEQQGGIWVDSTTIFLNGLTELENIMSEKYSHMITNRFSSEPDALLFYYSMGQNRIESKIIDPRNASQTILFNEMPNFEIWFIAAKKQAQVIKDIKKTYVEFTQTEFEEVEKKFRDEEIFMNRIDDFGHYLYLNMAVSYTLQSKQSELDKQLSLFGERKSVFDEYKLWGLHSEYGPMIMIREDLISLESIFLYSQQEFKDMGWNFIFFMKQFGYFRYIIGYYLDNLVAAFKGFDGSFDQWLSNEPDSGYCDNLTLIVEGSVFHKMLQESTVFNSTSGIRIFTKLELEKWDQYCTKHSDFFTKVKKFFKNSIFNTLILRLFMYDKVIKAKVHEILMEGEKLTLSEWLRVKYDDNSFLLFDFGYLLIVVLLMFWTYKKIVNKILEQLESQKSEEEEAFEEGLEFDRISVSKPNERNQSNNVERRKSEGENIKNKENFLGFMIFFLVLISFIMYNAVDVTGGREQPYTIFFFIVFTFLLESFIEEEIKNGHNKNDDNNNLTKIKYQYEFFFLFVNYITSYLSLVYVRRNRFWLNFCALVIGCIGPSFLKIARLISIKEKKNVIILDTKEIRLIVIIISALITFIPNLRYLSIQSGHILQWLPIIPLIYLILISIYVLYKSLTESLWLEILRLSVLMIVVIELCSMTGKISYITHQNPRMLFIFRNVIILQAIYLQSGSSISIKNLHEYEFLKSFINQALIFIGPLIIEFLFGRFYWSIEHISYLYYDYSEHLVIFAFSSYLVALFTSVEKNHQYHSVENIEIHEIEHSSFEISKEPHF